MSGDKIHALFDEPFYEEINLARWTVAERLIARLRSSGRVPLSSCLDAGCGVGWFSGRLAKLGLKVEGLEGRPEIAGEARRRVPGLRVHVADIQGQDLRTTMSPFDLLFCFGLLYHVENPFSVVRNLRALTRHVMLLESQVIPGDAPTFWLSEEGRNATQGLTYHAVIPSAPALVKMLQSSGFTHVYEVTAPVDHEDFRESRERSRRRRIYLASMTAIVDDDLALMPPVAAPKYEFRKAGHGSP